MSAEPVAVSCVSHVGMTVSELSVSVDFYTRLLGFSHHFTDVREGWSRVGLKLGDLGLELFSPPPTAAPDRPFDPFYPGSLGRPKIALTVLDVDEAYARLTAAGVVSLCPITTTRVSRFFLVPDPDGTPVQLHQFTGGQRRVTELSW